jgi:hypothetical protein
MELGRQENQSFLQAKPEKHGQDIVRLCKAPRKI